MMKTKIMSLILTVALIASMFAGCAQKEGDTEDTATAAPTQAPADTSEGTGDAQATEGASESYKIALLLSGNLGDMSFLDSANAGVQEIAQTYNAEVKVIEMGSDSTKYETNVLDASDADYDIIIGSGWQLQEPFENVAVDYPDKKYILFDASVDYTKDDYSNVYSITYKANEGSYLAGIMAASMSESGIIGFLGGMDGQGINDFLIGYIEGAQYINPDIKVISGYVGSYSDSPKCKEMALAQYSQGADFVFTAAGASGIGTLEAAKEVGKYAIGVDSDQAMLYKDSDIDQANLIPASVMKNVDKTLIRAYQKILDGSLTWGAAENLGLQEDAVGLSDNEFYQKLVPDDIKAKIEDAKEKIISGDITVTSAFGLTTDQVTEIIKSVAP
jgi:basic membrane protein A